MPDYDDGLYQWDKEKAAGNLAKHGVSFDEARTVFRDAGALTFSDPFHSTHEDRWITIGFSERGRILTVVSTDRDVKIRLISARRSARSEVASYASRRSQ